MSSRERRLGQLLDTIRSCGGQWPTSRVMDFRRRDGHTPCRTTARRDLAELARRGHLLACGPENARYYVLATLARKDARS
ncbi:hypothetical protein [Streptomyces longispororuber]|uniref:hypothetical protein n=1 Tax=Streptomyces longispororuber TaxID=68230 RepID=UPI00370319A4